MKCFYHSADLDGWCSGAIVKMAYPECEMIGINYGDAVRWERIEPKEMVFMVDFSLPMEDMERLSDLSELVWIDHHKSAIEAARERCFMSSGGQLLEIGRAGCELTWEWCFNGVSLPRAVFLLGRYDVWDHHNHPGALDFQYGMRGVGECGPESQGFWQRLFNDDHFEVDRIIQDGELLLAYEEAQNAMYVKSCAFEVELDGLRCIAVNKGLTNSLLFASVYDPTRHDVMLSFVRRPGKWTVSIYADKPEVDASEICKNRGGGGHKGAAGFQCDVLPF
jgi:oligoribonuclease NrnB/cAMP/cGMP phosphodiesterase (DHH superfamily)